jgi:signal transduction histidine kinase
VGIRADIEIKKDYGNLPLINCFPGQLNQVFMNILANAIDALDESFSSNYADDTQALITNIPQIIIQTMLSEEESQAVIKIKDNGMGMSQENKARIFDSLFTTKPVGKGTGLGLSIAQQIIVQKHGGKLEVNSELGKGAEFIINIPVE